MNVRGPAPRPCASCPYRVDVPAGVWHDSEYAKLREYDADTASQPTALFLCHQRAETDPSRRLCAGWVGCHGEELLAVRMAVLVGEIVDDDVAATLDYTSPVPLFSSGADAADHGVSAEPGPEARAVQAKISRVRDDIAG